MLTLILLKFRNICNDNDLLHMHILFFVIFTRILLLFGSYGCDCALRHEKVGHDVKENIVNILKAM